MGCGSCGSSINGVPAGCGNNGTCGTGGCNKLNTFDWLSDLPYSAQYDKFKVVEVSFKNGSRKGFFRNLTNIDCHTGDYVAVEGNTGGFDIGKISLSGELVRLQMKKKRVDEEADLPRLVRLASERDMERWEYAKEQEYPTMLMARVIARRLDLRMKIGDVEYQGDGRKATFYYTADERVDFRELIKIFAKEFRVKIEMRQIGARQEAGRIGGLGTCGRELCCSTWLTDFKSVSTAAARYQNLAINQSKLSGQCGRLKCCLNYELDTYLEALQEFPKNADTLYTGRGTARLIKTDIFKRLMWYVLPESLMQYPLKVDQVKHIQELNREGDKPDDLTSLVYAAIMEEQKNVAYDVGEVELDDVEELKREKRRKRKKRRRNRERERAKANKSNAAQKTDKPSEGIKKDQARPSNRISPTSVTKRGIEDKRRTKSSNRGDGKFNSGAKKQGEKTPVNRNTKRPGNKPTKPSVDNKRAEVYKRRSDDEKSKKTDMNSPKSRQERPKRGDDGQKRFKSKPPTQQNKPNADNKVPPHKRKRTDNPKPNKPRRPNDKPNHNQNKPPKQS